MIDPIGLLLSKGILNDPVQLTSRREIGAEGFFDNDASPTSFLCFVQADRFEVFQNRLELIRRDRKIKEAISSRPALFVDLIQLSGESFVARLIAKVALMIKD